MGSFASPKAIKPASITMKGIAILKNEARIGVNLAVRRFFALNALCTTRKSVVQYPKDKTKPKPRTIPAQLTSIPLSEGFPEVDQRVLKDAGTLANISSMLPISIIPRIETRNNPNQIKKN